MDDGIVLRADVFRPIAEGRYPAIVSYGPYGKGLAFQEGFKTAWDKMVRDFPETARGSSNKYAVFEVVDPEKWVPDGYVCVRIDCRGAGRSPGYLDLKSVRETKDLYDCIEWAARQPWCSGKVGLNGISYYATNQWYVASLQPPHLAAICVWEGAGDYYRENTHHGGILCNFFVSMYPWAVYRLQHGMGERGPRSRVTGEPAGGPETLPEEQLVRNRLDVEASLLSHPLDDNYYRGRSAVWSKITVPVLSAANWGGHGLHTRGNFEGFMRAASQQKWLEAHGDTHWTHFYTDYGVALQKRFLAHFLKGEDTGWEKQPRVQLQIRHVDKFVERHENEWPLARTQWTRLYLDPSAMGLQRRGSRAQRRDRLRPHGRRVDVPDTAAAGRDGDYGTGGGQALLSRPPAAMPTCSWCCACSPRTARRCCSRAPTIRTRRSRSGGCGRRTASSTRNSPLPYRPYHCHDELWPLSPGVPVELDVEIWPTSIVVPAGYRIGLSVRGNDFHYGGPPVVTAGSKFEQTGVGPFVHNNAKDRPRDVFSAPVTLHFGSEQQPYLLLPVIPAK